MPDTSLWLEPVKYVPKMKNGYAYRVPNTHEYVECMSMMQFQMEGPFDPFNVPEHRDLMDVLVASNHLRILIKIYFDKPGLETFRKFYDYMHDQYMNMMMNFQLEIVKVDNYTEISRMLLHTVRAESVRITKPMSPLGLHGTAEFLFWIRGRSYISSQGTVGKMDQLGNQAH